LRGDEAMKVKRENNLLKIELRLEKPVLSGSGKTLLVASSRGVKSTGIDYNGKEIAVVANAFVYVNPRKGNSDELMNASSAATKSRNSDRDEKKTFEERE
jgi:hypothetical protein